MWFFILVGLLIFALGIFYWTRQNRPERIRANRDIKTEASGEIGVPLEKLDPNRATQRDRLSGVVRPRTRPPEGAKHIKRDGSLAGRNLKKDNLPKEVELAWEAAEMIEPRPSALSRHEDLPGKSIKTETEPSDKSMEVAIRGPSEAFEESRYSLPARYGIDRLVLMARDPRWIYAYWEVTHEKYQEMYQKHLREWNLSRPLLRLYDLSPKTSSEKELDVFISEGADNWYIRVDRPRHRFIAELGRLFPKQRFVSFLRSNVVELPPDSFSSITSEEWAPLGQPDYYGRFRNKIGLSSPLIWGK